MIAFAHVLIEDKATAKQVLEQYRDCLRAGHVVAAAFDTETDGLHPIACKPFLFQCGYYDEYDNGWVFIVDIEQHLDVATYFIRNWNKLTEHGPIYLGHHVIFDQHMTENIGLRYDHWENLSDTQFFIRASSDAVQQDKGGEPLALKDWAVRHLSKDANKYEKELKAYRTEKAKKYNLELLRMTGWKKGKFNEFFKDKMHDASDLPYDIYIKYQAWFNTLPDYLKKQVTGVVTSEMIIYSELPRDRVIEYGYYDIEYTLGCYKLCLPVVLNRDNYKQIELENEQLRVFYEMERVGFKVDKDYLAECKVRTKEYTLRRRNDLQMLVGEPLSCHQNQRILDILLNCYGVESAAADKDTLTLVVGQLKRENADSDAIEFIETILELRSLEKWYSTYIRKFDYQLKLSDRIYTSIAQVGAVSGRITCDFQQFPKAGLTDLEGNELFDPRRMVIVDDEYPAICYLDYSAQELRVQALMTYLVGTPDMNMLRAYCPWQCHTEDGVKWNPENPMIVARAYDVKWYKDEDNELWVPTDLHGAMTKNIFEGITEDDPTFHDKRYIGKRANFMKTYGGGYECCRQSFPEFSDDLCHKIDEAYYKTYPGVKGYHEWCFAAALQPYTENLYGVKYYGVNGHHLRNMMIQGSCAYMTKNRQTALTNYIREHNLKSRFVMPIHDEVQIYYHKDDPVECLWEMKKIMQDIDSQVPIVSDMEITLTNWKEKFEVNSYEELMQVKDKIRSGN